MEASMYGVLMYVLGGAMGASFYLPFKKVKGWAWESYWFIYCVVALLIVPWILAVTQSPNVFQVLSATPWSRIGYCYLFGAMWGIGGLTWGLGIRYLGFGLGLALACGSCAGFGTLLPPLFDGPFPGKVPELLDSWHGRATLAGVAISLLGIVIVGLAGMSKERELSEEQKKAAVAEANFKKGVVFAVFAGIMSAGMEFGFRAGDGIKKLATETEPATPEFWLGLPVLVIILLGGFTVNGIWCLFLNAKNKTGGDYKKVGLSLIPNYVLSALAGVIWYGQMLLYTVGDTNIGEYKYSGWSIIMSSQIIFSTLLGIALLEWKGSSGRTRKLMAVGLAFLVVSLAVIGYGNYLESVGK
ncbi:MAG: L-rhamnose/proton symporter RhaT [Planctomycetes bacterium]|nr:L-rhamnose/proton symporter RhaT [Planctomycetota bacterium]